MRDFVTVPEKVINQELLDPVLRTTGRFWLLLFVLGGIFTLGLVSVGIMVVLGLGVGGFNRPVMWAGFITNMVFWIGISHAGVMISAILRISQAEWRRPVTRAAEVLTVFSLLTAVLMPLIHTGRPWRTLYWPFPYDFVRGIWPDVRSPFVWDPAAIFTYLIGASLFLYAALLPDLGNIRDRTTGWRHVVYGTLSLGWRGTPRQWKLQIVSGILLSAIILPVFVSVHSVVSWDFAVSLAPAWHSTIFAPYFVIGAVHSGVSAVITMMAVMRWLFKWENYITPDHFDSLGRLLIVVATGWFYFTLLEFFFSIYLRESVDLGVWNLRFYLWPWNLLMAIFVVTGYIIPVGLWLSKRVRRNIAAMFWISIFVNIAMWLERYLIIVPGLQFKQGLVFTWDTYMPSLIEAGVIFGTFGLVGMLLLLFSKFFPLIPLFDIKEGQTLRTTVKIGRKTYPAVIRE
jgi:molybdopterin-containing oxidoreductase family membrane subunit